MIDDTWRDMTLADVVDFRNGKAHGYEAAPTTGLYPIFGSNGIIGRIDKALYDIPVTVVGRVGAYCGSLHYSGSPSWVTDNAIAAIAKYGIDQRYLHYLLAGLSLRNVAIGSAQPLLTQSALNSIRARIAPLDEQRSIASILGALDDKIELNRKMTATLEAVARALFRSWFVDFDPVRAKADGRDPGLPVEIADLFPNSFETSDLGEIPKGWSTPHLSEVLEESNERIGEQVAPEYSSTNKGLQLRSARFRKSLSVSSAKNKLIQNGYFVFGLSRRILNFGLMRDELGSVSPAYRVFRVSCPAVSPEMLERLMRCNASYFYRAVSSSSREGQAVSTDGLGILRFVRPPQTIQEHFYRVDHTLASRIQALELESRTIAALRDALLPKLISGEIRVARAERLVKTSA